jgi:hypothetical protein
MATHTTDLRDPVQDPRPARRRLYTFGAWFVPLALVVALVWAISTPIANEVMEHRHKGPATSLTVDDYLRITADDYDGRKRTQRRVDVVINGQLHHLYLDTERQIRTDPANVPKRLATRTALSKLYPNDQECFGWFPWSIDCRPDPKSRNNRAHYDADWLAAIERDPMGYWLLDFQGNRGDYTFPRGTGTLHTTVEDLRRAG